jgi:hypothetical protein
MDAAETMYHIAEINVARARAALDDPAMADFVAQLDAVNAVADASEGFIWRLKADGGGASSYVSAFPDPRIIVNVSVWRSLDELQRYAYRSHEHAQVFRDRRKWFEKLDGPALAMWWVPAGTVPSLSDALHRLEILAEHGPTVDAFTFKAVFPPPIPHHITQGT